MYIFDSEVHPLVVFFFGQSLSFYVLQYRRLGGSMDKVPESLSFCLLEMFQVLYAVPFFEISIGV